MLEERLAGAEPVAAALRRENATLKRLLDAYESKRAYVYLVVVCLPQRFIYIY